MRRGPILAGGAAAIIVAGSLYLFPPFGGVDRIAHPSSEEFARGKDAFSALLSGPQGDLAGLAELGFEARGIEGADDAILLSETKDDCAGRGIYWLRSGSDSKLVITAPHRGSDRYTGQLASALFLETGARAAAWNSAPRRASENCPQGLDLAREKDHLFSAFALGFAEAQPDGLLVQLHGFDGERRNSLAAQEAGMILSNGTEEPDARLLDLADCLSLAFAPLPVLVYPGDTGELGALTNAQGQLLRENGFSGFAHIEISAGLRAALVEDGSLRAKMAGCLTKSAA